MPKQPLPPTRRQLLTTAAASAVAALLPANSLTTRLVKDDPPALPDAPLGGTGRTLPRLGLGAAQLSLPADEEQAIRVARHAIDVGMRYFDTAPSYGRGRSEERLGIAIERSIREGRVSREELFIGTKTLRRDAAGARRELEESLKRLRCDYVDSVQVHEVHHDWPRLFERDSVLEALEAARDEGLIRHIGITSHRDPADAIEACRRYEFATALVPVNPLDRKHLSFIDEFLPVAAGRGMGVIAMKIYAAGHLVAGDSPRFEAAELVRYALSQPHVAVAVPGCETIEHVDAAVAGLRPWKALSAEAQGGIEERAGEHRGKESEWYKNAPE